MSFYVLFAKSPDPGKNYEIRRGFLAGNSTGTEFKKLYSLLDKLERDTVKLQYSKRWKAAMFLGRIRGLFRKSGSAKTPLQNMHNLVQNLQEGLHSLDQELSRQTAPRVRLFYYPDYNRSNPYQRLLYSCFPQTFQVMPGDLDSVLSSINDSGVSLDHVFHLHWTTPVLAKAVSRNDARENLESFLDKLDRVIKSNALLVWTVHNILPHEAHYPDLETILCREVAARASIIHVHSFRVPELLRSYYSLPLHKTVVAAHGNYCGQYPGWSTEEARIRLELDLNCPVFLFLGRIRPYKGLGDLARAFSRCRQKYPRAILIIAGQIADSDLQDVSRLFLDMPGVKFFPGRVPGKDMGLYLAAADYLVLPYKRVLTSGSVLLGHSYGLPVIVPDLGLIRDYVSDGQNGYLYDPGDSRGLSAAMLRALDRHGALSLLSSRSLESAGRFRWEESAGMISARISSRLRISGR